MPYFEPNVGAKLPRFRSRRTVSGQDRMLVILCHSDDFLNNSSLKWPSAGSDTAPFRPAVKSFHGVLREVTG